MAPPSPFRRSVTGKVSLVAHRGASAVAPENTMAAFRLAAEAGCDLIEFDVHLTADDELVVIHDDTLDRTTDGRGAVREHTLARVAAVNASHGNARFPNERVPSLADLLDWARGTSLGLSLEIKQPQPASGRQPYPRIAERVADTLTAYGLVGRSLVHSFDHPTVRRMRELLPAIATGVPYSSGTFVDPLGAGRAADASGIHPRWPWVSTELCRAAHDAGMHVHAWGIGASPDAGKVGLLVRAGIDSMDSDDPAALRRLLADLA